MICPFCSKVIGLQKDRRGAYSSAYYCQNCCLEHICIDDIKTGDYVLQYDKYRFYIDVKNNRAIIEQQYMYIESDTSFTFRWYPIVSLPSIPEGLTQDNVAQKLKLYLLFS